MKPFKEHNNKAKHISAIYSTTNNSDRKNIEWKLFRGHMVTCISCTLQISERKNDPWVYQSFGQRITKTSNSLAKPFASFIIAKGSGATLVVITAT